MSTASAAHDDAARSEPGIRRAVHVGIVALLLATAWIAFVASSIGGPERAMAFGSTVTTSRLAEEHFGPDVFLNDKGYDGQYYWAIATQLPSLEGASDDVGYPRYRFQRIVTPALAAPFGDGIGAAVALLAVGAIGAGIGAGSLADLATRHGRPAWVGYLFLPPLVFALPTGLAEPLAYGLGMLAVALADRRRWWAAAGVFSVAVLTRESILLMCAAAVGGLLVTRAARFREVLPLALPLGVFVGWWALVGLWFEGGAPEEGELGPFQLFDAGPTGWTLGLLTLGIGVLGAWLWRDVPTAWPQALAFGLLVLTYEGSLFNWQVIYRANLPAWTFGLAGLAAVVAHARSVRTSDARARVPSST